jgi:WS/DGAT/MGAT family acyltransferase
VAWLLLESKETPMHVGALFEFVQPASAPPDYLQQVVARLRGVSAVRSPWNLRLVEAPVLGAPLPLMTEDRDVDLTYHVRHSALPRPGGQRELGVLISRLHSHPLDLRKPLWELHLIEGVDDGRFALYVKMHHSIIDGVSGMRLMARAFAPSPDEPDAVAFWGVEARARPRRVAEVETSLVKTISRGVGDVVGLGRAGLELSRAALAGSGPQAPFKAPASVLSSRVTGQRRIATQSFVLDDLKRHARAVGGTLNDVVLMLCGTALRRYLTEHGQLPQRSLTAGLPVSLRDAADQSAGGTSIATMVATLATNVANPAERLAVIMRSTQEAKSHLLRVPPTARPYYTLLTNGPWIGGLLLGLGPYAPVPFNVAISNVPGPPEPLYLHGSRLDAIYPASLLLHGNALNITCVSNAGALHFGFTGARDALPHLQRLAVYTGDALQDLEAACAVSA